MTSYLFFLGKSKMNENYLYKEFKITSKLYDENNQHCFFNFSNV